MGTCSLPLSLSLSLSFSFALLLSIRRQKNENSTKTKVKAERNGGGRRGWQMSENEPQGVEGGSSPAGTLFFNWPLINRTNVLSSTRARTVGVVQFRIKSNCSHAARPSPTPASFFPPPLVPSRRILCCSFKSRRIRLEFGVKFITRMAEDFRPRPNRNYRCSTF